MIPDEVIIRAGTNMLAHTDMVPLEYVRQLEREAKRYRFLRDHCVGTCEARGYIIDEVFGGALSLESFDDVIDAEIALRGE